MQRQIQGGNKNKKLIEAARHARDDTSEHANNGTKHKYSTKHFQIHQARGHIRKASSDGKRSFNIPNVKVCVVERLLRREKGESID
jgi:hypothetical protein